MYVKVKVTAGAKKAHFEQLSDESFVISVKEPKARNMANQKVLNCIAEYFDIPVSNVRIMRGHHRPNKQYFPIPKLHRNSNIMSDC